MPKTERKIKAKQPQIAKEVEKWRQKSALTVLGALEG